MREDQFLRIIEIPLIEVNLNIRFPSDGTQLSLGYPTDLRNGVKVMMQLPNDVARTIPILVENAEGVPVPAPAGDTYSFVSDDPTKLNGVIGTNANGAPTVTINALVRDVPDPGVGFTVSDSAGLKVVHETVIISGNVTPAELALDEANATDVPQPVPAA